MLQPEAIPLLKKWKDKYNKKDFQDAITYIYLMYDKNGVLADVLPGDRRKYVVEDYFNGKEKRVKEIEGLDDFDDLTDKFIKLTKSSSEIFLNGVLQKMDGYLRFWNELEIDIQTHKTVLDSLKGSNELYQLKKRLESEVLKEEQSRIVGGGETTRFEN